MRCPPLPLPGLILTLSLCACGGSSARPPRPADTAPAEPHIGFDGDHPLCKGSLRARLRCALPAANLPPTWLPPTHRPPSRVLKPELPTRK